jgi:hypothetical protein
MKLNKASIALFGGITAGFFVLGIAYFWFGGKGKDNDDIAIFFCIGSTMLVSWVLLYEEHRKKSLLKTCTKNSDTVTYYVP